MIRKVAMLVGGLVICAGGLYTVSTKSLADLTGLFRATADETVDSLAKNVPDEIYDRKTKNDLHAARQQLIDRQVELNLSRTQVDQLHKDVQVLNGSLARRQRLLAEAYPTLKQAVAEHQTTVRFASTDFSMPDFQKEVDELLAQQQREQRQLEIKRDGLARLEKSLGEGDLALTEMRTAMEGLDQELVVLKNRRDQAQIEAAALDLVSSATSGQETVASNVGRSVQRLKQDVLHLEARNEARRGLATASERPANQVGRAWIRLEALKTVHDEYAAQHEAVPAQQPAKAPAHDQVSDDNSAPGSADAT